MNRELTEATGGATTGPADDDNHALESLPEGNALRQRVVGQVDQRHERPVSRRLRSGHEHHVVETGTRQSVAELLLFDLALDDDQIADRRCRIEVPEVIDENALGRRRVAVDTTSIWIQASVPNSVDQGEDALGLHGLAEQG